MPLVKHGVGDDKVWVGGGWVAIGRDDVICIQDAIGIFSSGIVDFIILTNFLIFPVSGRQSR